MLIIRDKSESVARKILQKAGVNAPPYSGRIFWQWVQGYILRVCRTEKNINDTVSQRNDVRTDVENTSLAGHQSLIPDGEHAGRFALWEMTGARIPGRISSLLLARSVRGIDGLDTTEAIEAYLSQRMNENMSGAP